jgi:ribosomal protein S18 acetylase RimI-like enzyme
VGVVKSKLDVVQWGADRLRIGPWRGDASIAFIAPVAGRPTATETIDRCLRVLAAKGYARALTSALTVAEQEPFTEIGFTIHERLHLLRHPLDHLPAAEPHHLRRALPFDHKRVLELDGRAFDTFWRFDRDGLDDARRATPSSRFRVADDGGVVGYAITGRAGEIGYLQRLAVDPDRQHHGVGTALVVDGLWWAARRGARSVLVNTQEHNIGALSLYEHLGFVREPDGLAVLERDLDGPSA